MKPRYTPLAAAILAALAAPSFADDAQAPVAGTLETVKVVEKKDASQKDYQPAYSTVGGKTAQAVRDIPQTVTVVNKDLMQAQGATSLADALRNVPGITIGGAEGGQIGNNINLRGFTARTDIYIDGFRDRGQYYRDAFDLDQVEVLQGPSSMLFGRGSTGGVINQVTKKAQLKNFTEVSGTAGTDGRLRTTLDTNTKLSDTSALRVNVFGQDLKTTRDVMENKDFGVAPTIRFGIGEPTEVTLSALLQHNDDMPDYGVQSLNGSPVSPSRSTFYGLPTDRTTQDIAMLNGIVKHTINDTFEVRNQTQVNRYTTDAIETAPRALSTTNTTAGVITPPAFGNYNPSNLWVQLQSHDRHIVDTSVDNQTDLISKFSTGSIKHELVTGLELGRDTYSNQAYTRTGAGMASGMIAIVPWSNPVVPSTLSQTTTPGNLAESSANSMGVYFNDTVSLNEQWKVVAGLRHDRFNAQTTNTTSAPFYAKQHASFTSRRAGVIYQPTEDQSYYASYGTSFNPLLEQMTITNGTQSLPPTNTRSYEVGGKWNIMNDKLSLTAAAFNELQSNVYTKDTSGTYYPAGNWLIKGYSLSAAGHVTDKLQVSTGYMHLVPRIVNTLDATNGARPANTPKDTFNLWATYDVTRSWEVGGGPNFMSQRYATGTTASTKVSVPSYTRWDATVAYHKPKYEIRVNVLNLTNKYYYDALVPSDGGRAVPGIGRTALLTGTYKF